MFLTLPHGMGLPLIPHCRRKYRAEIARGQGNKSTGKLLRMSRDGHPLIRDAWA